jgi:hypothetical protein
MTMALGLLGLALAATEGTPVIPAYFTGERLLEICTEQNVGLCSMYVTGVADGIFHAETGETRTLCRGDLSNRDARMIVTDYLRDHREVRRHAAAVAVQLALKPSIGCSDEPAPEPGAETTLQKGK